LRRQKHFENRSNCGGVTPVMKKSLFTLAILAFFVAVASAQTITLPKLPTAALSLFKILR
jgi:hypothetical protein